MYAPANLTELTGPSGPAPSALRPPNVRVLAQVNLDRPRPRLSRVQIRNLPLTQSLRLVTTVGNLAAHRDPQPAHWVLVVRSIWRRGARRR